VFADPLVCKAKFDREVDNVWRLAGEYHRRGVWLIDATFPEVYVALVATNIKPAIIPFGVVINFDNYDVEPPSVRFVHPFNRTPLKMSEIGTVFPTLMGFGPQGQPNVQGLVQAFSDERPFLCMQGVREYHDNPAHSGDSWLLHRNTGIGTLAHLLQVLVKHGSEPIKTLTVAFQAQAQVNAVQYLPELVSQ